MDGVIALKQISVTALFYLDNNRKIHPRGMRACDPKTRREEHLSAGERESPLAPLFMSWPPTPPPGLPSVNWVSRECCLFYLRSSLRSSDLPLFYFHGLFSSLSLATTILDSVSLF